MLENPFNQNLWKPEKRNKEKYDVTGRWSQNIVFLHYHYSHISSLSAKSVSTGEECSEATTSCAARNVWGCQLWVEGCWTSTHCSGGVGINCSHYGNQKQLKVLLNKRFSFKYYGHRGSSSSAQSWPGLRATFQLKCSWLPALLLLREPEMIFSFGRQH